MITAAAEKTFWFILNLVSANQMTAERWCRSGTAGCVKQASIRLKGFDVVFTTCLQRSSKHNNSQNQSDFYFRESGDSAGVSNLFLLTVDCICNVCHSRRQVSWQFFCVAIVLTIVTAVCRARHLLQITCFVLFFYQIWTGSLVPFTKSHQSTWDRLKTTMFGISQGWCRAEPLIVTGQVFKMHH